MEIIDFDSRFEAYLKKWMQENKAQYGGNMDLLEEMMPDIYLGYLDTPADFLGGITPKAYFEAYQDPSELAEMLFAYHKSGKPIPDLLLERLVELGSASVPVLLSIMRDPEQDEEMRMTAASLLAELECIEPMEDYIEHIVSQEEADGFGDLCAEALVHMGRAAVAPILARYAEATEAGKDVFADVLSNFAGEELIYPILLERFQNRPENRALFASYLGKFQDERALPELERVLEDPRIGFLDFIEISNAIEALGGERPADRDFDGDPYFEAMKKLQ